MMNELKPRIDWEERLRNSSAEKVANELLDRIEKSDLNAYVWTDRARTVKMARDSDEYRKLNSPRALEGLPIGIKDLFCMTGTPTYAGSRILEGFVSPYESTVTQRLWDAGAVFLGKQNLDGFGMGSTTTNSMHGPALNPYCKNNMPTSAGGSSGGGSAAVAGDLAWVSIGSDTGGSCRAPAAWTGIVGFKPTYGLVSRFGMIAHASSLDCPGIMAHSVKDIARVLQVIAGFDPDDAQTYDKPVPDFCNLNTDISDLKIAINDLGTKVKIDLNAEHVDIDHILQYAVECYYIISASEACSNLARYDGIRYGHRTSREYNDLQDYYCKTRSEGFSDESKRRILLGAYSLSQGSKVYKRASQIRQWISDEMQKIWDKYDVLITPTMTIGAMTLEEIRHTDCSTLYKSDQSTVMPSLIGGCAISVPIGFDEDNMPFGIQVIGRPFADATVLRVASAIEKIVDKNAYIKRRI